MVDEYRTPSQNHTANDDNDGHEEEGGEGRVDEGAIGEDEEEENNLLFSCQCDSARKVATLLSCLRRVVTAGGGGSSTFGSNFPGHGGGGGGGNISASIHQGGGGTQSTAAAMAVSGMSASRIQHATVYAGPEGLTFHVQHGLARQSQCSVDMPRALFREYFVGEEEVWLEEEEEEDDDDDHSGHVDDSDDAEGRRRRCTREIIRGGEFAVNLTTVLECFSILSKTGNRPSSTSSGDGGGGGGEYASLANVPLCMSYDRGTATFHLEFLEGGILPPPTTAGGMGAASPPGGGGCLVTCEVPGVAIADDDVVNEVPDPDETSSIDGRVKQHNNNSGLAAAFRSSPLVSRAILYSDALQSAVSELYDVPGASVVEVSLSRGGLEFGCVGPRSEVWVKVPYHRAQSGLYVGLECYAGVTTISSGGRDGNNIAWRYPLGAFLSGMRGLDIGVETCISVNARGMMAIQHQVSRDAYHDPSGDGGGVHARPSFVDFIMTCIENDGDEEVDGGPTSREDASAQLQTIRHGGLQDITNTESDDLGGREARAAGSTENRPRAATAVSTSDERGKILSSEEEGDKEKDRFRKTGNNGKRHDDNDSDGDFDGRYDGEYDGGENDFVTTPKVPPNDRDSATNPLREALEYDKDLLFSHNSRSLSDQGRNKALEDIRRRRRERQELRQSFEQTPDLRTDEDDNYNGKNGVDRQAKRLGSGDDTKRVGAMSKADFRKARYSEEANDQNGKDFNLRKEAQDSQTQSEEDDGDTTELEDSLDVTAEIPNLFSKRSSLSTSSHGGSKRRKGVRDSNDRYSDDDDESELELEQEPRMMYGDTKLEFTQDNYSD
ncbi:hypothetical protein ACHAXA_007417 [Cyclostephanos tholiformis]|uniref:Uncharacterized protein n=1 Tax=Cyclostephanos tholiformis TaxID=382380 RepID=A0ABD3SD00_9STRA